MNKSLFSYGIECDQVTPQSLNALTKFINSRGEGEELVEVLKVLQSFVKNIKDSNEN